MEGKSSYTLRPFRRVREELDRAIAARSHDLVAATVHQRIPPENTFSLPHGTTWSQGDPRTERELVAYSHEKPAPIERIATGDLSVLVDLLREMAESLMRDFMRHIYEDALKATPDQGFSSFEFVPGRFAESFLEAVRRTRVRINDDGTVSQPELHLHPSIASRVVEELRAQPASFTRKFTDLQALKRREAVRQELARLSRFRWQDSEPETFEPK